MGTSATESNVSDASAEIRGRSSAGGTRGVRRTRGWENAAGVLPGRFPGAAGIARAGRREREGGEGSGSGRRVGAGGDAAD